MLRFLWFDDVGKENPVMVQYQFCCLVFGLTPSPAILTEVINHHITRYLMTEWLKLFLMVFMLMILLAELLQ